VRPNVSQAIFFVGFDWAATSHAVCVLDTAGRRVVAFTVEDSAAAGLAGRMARIGDLDAMPVTVERAAVTLVDTLLEAGHPVVPETRAPHIRADLLEMWVAATNQLAALLEAHWPAVKAIFAGAESLITLELLTRYPTARAVARPRVKRLAAFCAKHGYPGPQR
jgi:hypothetical protein